MTSTVVNPAKKNLLIKKNIIVRFDSINRMYKPGKNNNNGDTYVTVTTIPTSASSTV